MVITMWRHELTLITQTFATDQLGNQVPTKTEIIVYCDVKSISRSEFYYASNTGLKPSIVFTVNDFDYNKQELVKFEGQEYNVIRTYLKSIDKVELTCQKVAANG